MNVVHLSLQAMVAKGLVEEQTGIQVVAALRFQVGIGFLYQSVAKHLHSLGHTEGTLKAHLHLERWQQVVGGSGAIAITLLTAREFVPALGLLKLVDHLIGRAVQAVHLTKHMGVPAVVAYLVAQSGDILGELLGHVVHLVVGIHLIIALSANG